MVWLLYGAWMAVASCCPCVLTARLVPSTKSLLPPQSPRTMAPNRTWFLHTYLINVIICDFRGCSVEKGTSKADTAKVTSFFFAGVTGAVHYADDLGNSSDLDLNLAAAVDVLEFNPDNDRLVIITRNLLLTQVQMAADGHTDTVQKVKLSMKCEAGVQAAGWVGEHLLATSSADEPYIRCVVFADAFCFGSVPAPVARLL
jgi:hypothetical protein